MLSYHNEPATKLRYQECFAGSKAPSIVNSECFVENTSAEVLDNYSRFPIELGWPEWLAHLADKIFQGIPEGETVQFGADLLEAVPVGVDLEPVKWKLAIWRHMQQLDILRANTADCAEPAKVAMRMVIQYCQAQLDGSATDEMREAARAAVKSASDSACASSILGRTPQAILAAAAIVLDAISSASSSTVKYIPWPDKPVEWSAKYCSGTRAAAWSAEHAARCAIRAAAWNAARKAEAEAKVGRRAAERTRYAVQAASEAARETDRFIWYQQERDMLLKLLAE